MNRGIVSRHLDQLLIARIGPEPCACLQLACACLSTSRGAVAWSPTIPLWSSRVTWIKIDIANFANLTFTECFGQCISKHEFSRTVNDLDFSRLDSLTGEVGSFSWQLLEARMNSFSSNKTIIARLRYMLGKFVQTEREIGSYSNHGIRQRSNDALGSLSILLRWTLSRWMALFLEMNSRRSVARFAFFENVSPELAWDHKVLSADKEQELLSWTPSELQDLGKPECTSFSSKSGARNAVIAIKHLIDWNFAVAAKVSTKSMPSFCRPILPDIGKVFLQNYSSFFEYPLDSNHFLPKGKQQRFPSLLFF